MASGAGLGLAIAQAIADAHGGEIQCVDIDDRRDLPCRTATGHRPQSRISLARTLSGS